MLVLAHGAGAGMRHVFMSAIATALEERRIATLRYQFPYMEQAMKRPDRAPLLEATVRAAVEDAQRRNPALATFAGGKSMGGRMTSQAAAKATLENVRGLVFLGFPLHRPDDESDARATHLADVRVPMLFVQGTRDELADLDRMRAVVARLGSRATMHVIDEANHAFSVPRRTGRTETDVITEIADAVAAFVKRHLGS